ncbi:MAG: type I-F CRISPR-associated endoribonuclease Cas6/Csy4 [Helicobacteraceae bacterium 4484_230]|nr:MAG: type I-F CRISPR-associated endoribonuclease Cas6/Csy4 [Helicobacteraceae bacterium 4484_230]
MKHYIDIKMLGDTEISLGFIWQKVYAQLHLALVDIKDKNDQVPVGFSFPYYNKAFPLGDTLRIFSSSQKDVEALHIDDRLQNLLDYINIGTIKEVPVNINIHVTFGRRQFKTNPERLARRYAKRHDVGLEEALRVYKEMKADETKLPFINIKSFSTGQHLRLFIEKCASEREQIGKFNTFGLSKTTTVPWF